MLAFSVGEYRDNEATAEFKEGGRKQEFTDPKVKLLDECCHKCGSRMNSWDRRLTNTFKVVDTCERCFCSIYDMDKDAFRKQMEDFFDMRPCQGL